MTRDPDDVVGLLLDAFAAEDQAWAREAIRRAARARTRPATAAGEGSRTSEASPAAAAAPWLVALAPLPPRVIARARRERGLRRRDVALLAGLTTYQVRRVERSTWAPRANVVRVLEVLGLLIVRRKGRRPLQGRGRVQVDGDAVRAVRLARGRTVRQVARDARLEVADVEDLEDGRGRPDSRALGAVLEALGVREQLVRFVLVPE